MFQPKPKVALMTVSFSALKSEKVKLVACGRDHTVVCTCKMLNKYTTNCFSDSFSEYTSDLYMKFLHLFLLCISPAQGGVYSAGRNQEGQLGLGHRKSIKSFQLLRPFCDQAQIKMLSAGCNTSAALTGLSSDDAFHMDLCCPNSTHVHDA